MLGRSRERRTEKESAGEASSAYLSAINLNRVEPVAWACVAEIRIRSGVNP